MKKYGILNTVTNKLLTVSMESSSDPYSESITHKLDVSDWYPVWLVDKYEVANKALRQYNKAIYNADYDSPVMDISDDTLQRCVVVEVELVVKEVKF